MTLHVTPSNWESVKNDIASQIDDQTLLDKARNYVEFIGVVAFYKDQIKRNLSIELPQFESLSLIDYSPFFVWLLSTYCLNGDVDGHVKRVIDLHQRIVEGIDVSREEWINARDKAWNRSQECSSRYQKEELALLRAAVFSTYSNPPNIGIDYAITYACLPVDRFSACCKFGAILSTNSNFQSATNQ